METISNFEFLKKDYPDLYKIGKEIEVCYSVDEDSAKVKCRLFIDILSLKIFNSYSNINPNNTYESLDEKFRLLKNILPANFIKEINAFDEIRIAGNNAAHPQQKYRRSKTEDIIQKTYYLSVQFYNYLQNQNISAKQFSFLKKSNVQQKEFELTLAAKNRELASEKERIKSLEEKLNLTAKELSKITHENNPEKFDQLTERQNELKTQIKIQEEKEKNLSSEIQSKNEELDRIKKEKKSIEIQKQKEIENVNKELSETRERNKKLEKQTKEQKEIIKNQHAELIVEKAEQEKIRKEKEVAIAAEIAAKKKIILEKDSELALEKEKIEARSKEKEEKIKSKYAIVPLAIILFLVFLSYFRNNQEAPKSDSNSKPTTEVAIEKPKLNEDNFSNDQGFMDWFKAHEKCKSIKMRLPTKEELRTAYLQGLTKTWRHGRYWSDTESVKGSAYMLDTSDGFFHSAFKDALKLKTKCFK